MNFTRALSSYLKVKFMTQLPLKGPPSKTPSHVSVSVNEMYHPGTVSPGFLYLLFILFATLYIYQPLEIIFKDEEHFFSQ